MNYHNTDVVACDNNHCKLKLNCLRWWLGTNKDPYQFYATFEPKGDKCDKFVNYTQSKI